MFAENGEVKEGVLGRRATDARRGKEDRSGSSSFRVGCREVLKTAFKRDLLYGISHSSRKSVTITITATLSQPHITQRSLFYVCCLLPRPHRVFYLCPRTSVSSFCCIVFESSGRECKPNTCLAGGEGRGRREREREGSHSTLHENKSRKQQQHADKSSMGQQPQGLRSRDIYTLSRLIIFIDAFLLS